MGPSRTIDCRVLPAQPEQLDTRPDLLIALRAGEQWGVLSLDEIRACGVAKSAVTTRVANGRLHRVHRGIYAVGHSYLTIEGRFLAAVKACGPDAVLSHFSAAALWGLVEWDDRYPEVTVPGTATRVRRGVRVHRSTTLAADDVVRYQRIPITSPARTALDVCSILDYRGARRAVRQAQSRRRVTHGDLASLLNRSRPTRGAGLLARILATGPAPTRSELEDVVLDLMLDGGLAHPDVNVPLMVSGRYVIPDFRWPAHRLVVEADGARWHDGEIAREDDAERQALLEADGERVVRVTWTQAIAERAQTLARIRAAGAPLAASQRG